MLSRLVPGPPQPIPKLLRWTAVFSLFASAATGEESPTAGDPVQPRKSFHFQIAEKPVRVAYSRRGLELASRDGHYQARVWGRIQLRFSNPLDQVPSKEDDFRAHENHFGFRRARLNVEANVFRPWIELDFTYDVANTQPIGYSATIRRYEWLQFHFGQSKPEFGRERFTSSGRQQFAERSIVNEVFNADRQIGFGLRGHLMPNSRADSWYSVGVFTGNGRNNWFGGGGHPMFVARYQWNFLGRDLDFSSSDIEHHERPAAGVAVAGLSSRRRYTSFSSDGGDQLEGFAVGAPGQYSLKQATTDFLLKYRGVSVQHEFHWKHIRDNVDASRTTLRGAYAQAGWFPHYAASGIPKPLELGYRYAIVDTNTARPGDMRGEHAFVINWFFEGHDNKLTFEVGRLTMSRPGRDGLKEFRYRLQWDVQF